LIGLQTLLAENKAEAAENRIGEQKIAALEDIVAFL